MEKAYLHHGFQEAKKKAQQHGMRCNFPEHPRDPLSLPTPHFLVSTTSQQGHIRNQLGTNLFIKWEPLRSSHFLKALRLATKPGSELLGNTSYPHHSTFLLRQDGQSDAVFHLSISSFPVFPSTHCHGWNECIYFPEEDQIPTQSEPSWCSPSWSLSYSLHPSHSALFPRPLQQLLWVPTISQS